MRTLAHRLQAVMFRLTILIRRGRGVSSNEGLCSIIGKRTVKTRWTQQLILTKADIFPNPNVNVISGLLERRESDENRTRDTRLVSNITPHHHGYVQQPHTSHLLDSHHPEHVDRPPAGTILLNDSGQVLSDASQVVIATSNQAYCANNTLAVRLGFESSAPAGSSDSPLTRHQSSSQPTHQKKTTADKRCQ